MKRKANVLNIRCEHKQTKKITKTRCNFFHDYSILKMMFSYAIANKRAIDTVWKTARITGVSENKTIQVLCAAVFDFLKYEINLKQRPTFTQVQRWLPLYVWTKDSRWENHTHIILHSCQFGDVNLLDAWYTSQGKPEFKELDKAMEVAIRSNRIPSINWLTQTFSCVKFHFLDHEAALLCKVMTHKSLLIFKWLHEKFKFNVDDLKPWVLKMISIIVGNNDFLMLEWIHETWPTLLEGEREVHAILFEASKHQRLNIMIWAKGVFKITKKIILQRSNIIWNTALANGRISILEWIHNNYSMTKIQAQGKQHESLFVASNAGYLTAISWFHKHFTISDIIVKANRCFVIREALKHKQVSVAKWWIETFLVSLQDLTGEKFEDPTLFHICANNGLLDTLQWLHDYYGLSTHVIMQPVSYIIECTLEKKNTLFLAARCGDVPMVRWLCETFEIGKREIIDDVNNFTLETLIAQQNWEIVNYLTSILMD